MGPSEERWPFHTSLLFFFLRKEKSVSVASSHSKPSTCSLRTARACTPTSPGSVGSVAMAGAALPTTPKPSRWSSSAPQGRSSRSQWWSSGPAPVTTTVLTATRLSSETQSQTPAAGRYITCPLRSPPTEADCSHPPSNEYKKNYEELLSRSESHVFSEVIGGQLYLSFFSWRIWLTVNLESR